MTKHCYDVGYGKPPLQTRFRKGQSGNPKGRSKGTKNFATIFMTAMSQSVTINENGKRKKISKIAAAVTRTAADHAAVIARLIAARRPARVLAESRADGKGAGFATGKAIFRGYHPAIPLTIAYSAIFVTIGQKQHGG